MGESVPGSGAAKPWRHAARAVGGGPRPRGAGAPAGGQRDSGRGSERICAGPRLLGQGALPRPAPGCGRRAEPQPPLRAASAVPCAKSGDAGPRVPTQALRVYPPRPGLARLCCRGSPRQTHSWFPAARALSGRPAAVRGPGPGPEGNPAREHRDGAGAGSSVPRKPFFPSLETVAEPCHRQGAALDVGDSSGAPALQAAGERLGRKEQSSHRSPFNERVWAVTTRNRARWQRGAVAVCRVCAPRRGARDADPSGPRDEQPQRSRPASTYCRAIQAPFPPSPAVGGATRAGQLPSSSPGSSESFQAPSDARGLDP